MAQWRHRITIHTGGDVQAFLPDAVEDLPPTIFCDDEGACYFDAGPNPLTQAIERLLDEEGDSGWELVQVAFRPDQMIGFWKRSGGAVPVSSVRARGPHGPKGSARGSSTTAHSHGPSSETILHRRQR